MDIDTSIGSVGDEFPEILNVLVDRTGFNPEHIAIWEGALEGGYFPHGGGLPLFEGIPATSSFSAAHDFGAIALTAAASEDADDSCSYAYVSGDEGAIFAAAEALLIWRDEGWWTASWSIGDTTPERVRAAVGTIEGVILGITGEVDVINAWDLEESALLESGAAQSWIDDHRLDEVTFDDILEVPGVAGEVSLYLVNFWGLPTFGPPAPDPSSEYHRLRIAALRLSTLGIDVTIDWGPFEQTYAAESVGAEFAGSVFINTMSSDYFTTGGGILRNSAVTGADEGSVDLAKANLRDFGLGE